LSIVRIDRGLDFMNEMLPANLPLDGLMREAGYVPQSSRDEGQQALQGGCSLVNSHTQPICVTY
jgi:hypothetical protein